MEISPRRHTARVRGRKVQPWRSKKPSNVNRIILSPPQPLPYRTALCCLPWSGGMIGLGVVQVLPHSVQDSARTLSEHLHWIAIWQGLDVDVSVRLSVTATRQPVHLPASQSPRLSYSCTSSPLIGQPVIHPVGQSASLLANQPVSLSTSQPANQPRERH